MVAFGDGTAMATELDALMVAGRKRATCSLARDYSNASNTLPKVGDLVVVVDGSGTTNVSGGQPRSRSNYSGLSTSNLHAMKAKMIVRATGGSTPIEHASGAKPTVCGFAFDDSIESDFERIEII